MPIFLNVFVVLQASKKKASRPLQFSDLASATPAASSITRQLPLVDVYLVSVENLKLIERDKAKSQAMVVMNVGPKLTKRYKDHIYYGKTAVIEDSS